jgi:hypothetical protein
MIKYKRKYDHFFLNIFIQKYANNMYATTHKCIIHYYSGQEASSGNNTLIKIFDDCISILVCMILPVLEQRGIDGDLRTRRLLGGLKQNRILLSEIQLRNNKIVLEEWKGIYI